MSGETVEKGEEKKLDVDKDLLRTYKVHYGRSIKTKFSESFIYGIHPRGFYLIDLNKTLEKLSVAAKFLSRYEPQEVLVHTSREYGYKAIEMMGKILGYTTVVGRFPPGSLTNYILDTYKEVSVLLVLDHTYDQQAVDEAVKVKIPVVSFVDTNSTGEFVDLAIPGNNKGRGSIAALIWSLTVLILRELGTLKEDEVVEASVEDFMVLPEEVEQAV
ncbi:30S ribosomal protein S2 [Candidatus Geothermarchaeota archaeon ex4572_27]|nr:MAG: 30S ribosomal protein S2 [Candidatus Geothermarchaeota archaeon ex4572_27]